MMKRILAISALALVISGVAQAQRHAMGSDFSGPGGAGAGAGGTIGAFVPTGGEKGPSAANVNGVATSFQESGSITTTVGRDTVLVSGAAAALVGGTLAGNPTMASTLTTHLTGSVGAGPAGTLVQALQGLGASPSFANLVVAINAYNAAVAALPAGQQAPAELLAARVALQRLSGGR